MPRPTRITNDQILEAARTVFLEQGYGAPTLEVARRAGVSEGTLYKRFETKESLFAAAMGADSLPERLDALAERIGLGDDARADLVAIIVEAIELLREHVPCALMVLSRGTGSPASDGLAHAPDAPPVRAVAAVTRLLESQASEGHIRCSDPGAAGRMMVASALQFVFWELMGLNPAATAEPAVFASNVVDLLWEGLAPEVVP